MAVTHADLRTRMQEKRAFEAVGRDLLASARTAQLPDGRTFTGVPLSLAVELLDHLDVDTEGDVFVAVDERHLRRLADARGVAEWTPTPLGGSRDVLVAGDLDVWMTATGTTNEALGARLGLAATTVNAWRRGYARMNAERSAQLRALMKGIEE